MTSNVETVDDEPEAERTSVTLEELVAESTGDSSDTDPEEKEPGGMVQRLWRESREDGVSFQPGRERTHRTRGLEVIAAGVIGLGALLGSGDVFLLAVPLLLAIVYHRATELPTVALSASREFSQVSVVPGDTVTVEVTVRNDGDSNLADVRLRDDVPDSLSVVDGSPMGSFSMEPGESVTLSYEVIARRGRHRFDAVEALCRGVSGSSRQQCRLDAERTLVASVSLDTIPLASRASNVTGRLETTFHGSGVELYSTREYHPSDSPRDIDWRTYAKSGEFTTIEYKDTRAASIHLVVDRRAETFQQDGRTGVTTGEMCLYAAEHIAETLIADRHQVGVSAIDTATETQFPANSPAQYRSVRGIFTDNSASSNVPETGSEPDEAAAISDSLADDFVEQTASHTQFVCCTGLYDSAFEGFLSRLVSHNRSVLVVSPRHEPEQTPGSNLAVLQRSVRIDQLRRAGIRVLDWETEEPLRLAIERRVGGLHE